MFGLGVPELIIILVLVLLIFGPRKLPELGSFVGKSLRDFRDALDRRDEEPPSNLPTDDEETRRAAASHEAKKPDA
jgi:sec-independent protein translocase protein TatA